jgi:hypothetical protein
MSGKTKPRRPRGPRLVSTNPLLLAIFRASKASAETIEAILAPIRDGFTALREGVASELQWAVVASSVNVALTIENQGVVTGLAAHLQAAEQALKQIRLRAMATGHWKPTALYWQEIDAIDEFVPLHKFQLEQLSTGEVIRAMDKTEAVIRSMKGQVMKAGPAGGQQMNLIGAMA